MIRQCLYRTKAPRCQYKALFEAFEHLDGEEDPERLKEVTEIFERFANFDPKVSPEDVGENLFCHAVKSNALLGAEYLWEKPGMNWTEISNIHTTPLDACIQAVITTGDFEDKGGESWHERWWKILEKVIHASPDCVNTVPKGTASWGTAFYNFLAYAFRRIWFIHKTDPQRLRVYTRIADLLIQSGGRIAPRPGGQLGLAESLWNRDLPGILHKALSTKLGFVSPLLHLIEDYAANPLGQLFVEWDQMGIRDARTKGIRSGATKLAPSLEQMAAAAKFLGERLSAIYGFEEDFYLDPVAEPILEPVQKTLKRSQVRIPERLK